MAKNAGLGKGLSALINSGQYVGDSSGYEAKFDIENIKPNPYQPRMHIDPEELVGIADSIREHGIIQPLVITKSDKGEGYVLIAGERRFRAAQLAGLKYVPVVIKEASQQEMLELALIENVQRKDLNPLEEATAFKQLQGHFGMTHKEIARKMSMSRVAVTNKIRLLALPMPVQESVLHGHLAEGHARALLGISEETSIIAAANIVLRRNLTVRETEDLVRKINFGNTSTETKRRKTDREAKQLLTQLSNRLGYTTRVQRMSKGGKLTIRFTSDTELKDIMKKLMKMTDNKSAP